ncbi:MAG: GNAT family N-acetyltransferase [Thermoplasmata archaeon]
MPVSRPKIQVRRGSVGDIPLLVRHRTGMHRELPPFAPSRVLREHERTYRRWLGQNLPPGQVIALIAEDGMGHPMGSGCVWFYTDHPRPGIGVAETAYLMSMFTEPAFRRIGVASRLVREAIRTARGRGCPRMVLHAAPMARELYPTFGFERTWEMRIWLEPRLRRAHRHSDAVDPAAPRAAGPRSAKGRRVGPRKDPRPRRRIRRRTP